MRRSNVVPLSAREVADTERAAWPLVDASSLRSAPGENVAWATLFLRLLALHRATERQSLLLQAQVAQLERDIEQLEAYEEEP